MIALDAAQRDAVAGVVDAFLAGAPIVALIGGAGVGKSECMQEVGRLIVERMRVPVIFTAPTAQAVSVLRSRGAEKPITTFRACLRPLFTPEVEQVLAMLRANEQIDKKAKPNQYAAETIADQLDKNDLFRNIGLPQRRAVALDAVAHGLVEEAALWRRLGIDIMAEYFVEWVPRTGTAKAVLVIDEASFLALPELLKCTQVFPRILLVGDDMQLPPVDKHEAGKDPEPSALDSALASTSVPRFRLTENYRTRSDDPRTAALAKFSDRVRREGYVFPPGRVPALKDDDQLNDAPLQYVRAGPKLVALAQAGAVLITYTNAARRQWIATCRKALGYRAGRPVVGELIQIRETKKADQEHAVALNLEFGRNQLCRVHRVLDGGALLVGSDAWPLDEAHLRTKLGKNGVDRQAQAQAREGVNFYRDDAGTAFALVRIEPFFEDDNPRGYFAGCTPVRFAYALTAHAAQGSQFDTVILDMAGVCAVARRQRGPQDLFPTKWVYTAVSRAQRRLIAATDIEQFCVLKWGIGQAKPLPFAMA